MGRGKRYRNRVVTFLFVRWDSDRVGFGDIKGGVGGNGDFGDDGFQDV